jgi:hypothetical protein
MVIIFAVIVIYAHITLSTETMHLPSGITLPPARELSRRGHQRHCQMLRTQQMSLLLRVNIPTCHLFYEMPTSKGQLVVVISDDHTGEIYVTCEPNENKVFPLV